MKRLFNRKHNTMKTTKTAKRVFNVCVWHQLGNEVKYIYYKLNKQELNLLEKNNIHFEFCNQFHDFTVGLK